MRVCFVFRVLYSAISENQEEFIRLLNEPVSDADRQAAMAAMGATMAAVGAMGDGDGDDLFGGDGGDDDEQSDNADLAAALGAMPGGGAGVGGGANVVRVTPEQSAAVERLMQLGFSRDAVLQAFFACDCNEELAASTLL